MKNLLMCALLITAGPALAQARDGLAVGATKDRVAPMAAKRFKKLDQNSDGSIDVAEVTAALQARSAANGKAVPPQRAARMIKRNDTNGDGKVTSAEFAAAAVSRFDSADANHNGTIDATEAAKPATDDNE